MALPESIAKFVAVIAGGSSTPAVPAGYFRWYDASDANRVYSDAYTTLASGNDPVYVIEDKFSADGTNGLAQTLLGVRPIWTANGANGLYTAYHDGTKVIETSAVDGTALTELAFGLVIRTGASITSGGAFFSWAETGGSVAPFILIKENGSGSFQVYVSGGYRWTFPIAINTTYVIGICYDSGAGQWKLKVNGVADTPYSGGLTNQANANGFYTSGFGGASIFHFCEAIVYDENAIVTTIDDLCDNVSSYLISKWGA